jgi:hypothetical protein
MLSTMHGGHDTQKMKLTILPGGLSKDIPDSNSIELSGNLQIILGQLETIAGLESQTNQEILNIQKKILCIKTRQDYLHQEIMELIKSLEEMIYLMHANQ